LATEWATLRTLARRTVNAAAQTMIYWQPGNIGRPPAANLDAGGDLLAEQRVMGELVGEPALPDYTGATQLLIDARWPGANYLEELVMVT